MFTIENDTMYEAMVCPLETDSDDKDKCCGTDGDEFCCSTLGL